jgi:RecB family exonuclease/superfamily I DNA/RNA helicase
VQPVNPSAAGPESRPPLDLLLAPAAAGKTRAAAELLAAAPGLAVALVPNAHQQALLRARLGSLRHARVVQFETLARLILRQAGQPAATLDGAARQRLVRRLLAELRDAGALPTYARVAAEPGFVAVAAALLDDLASAAIDPPRFAAAARSPHDAELATLYARYEAFQRQHGLADLPRRLSLACAALRSGAGLPGVSLLIADGFDQLTPLQLALLAELARRAPLTLTLTASPQPRVALRRFERTLAELRERFQTRERRLPPGPDTRSAPLRQIEAHLFALDDPPAAPAGGLVALAEAADREREVRAALRHLRLLLDRGAAPEQIALLYRDGAPYLSLLREVAAEYGLPLDLAEGLPLAGAPPVAALLALLRLPGQDFPRRGLLEALRNPYVAAARPTTNGQRPTADDEGAFGDEGRRAEDEGPAADEGRDPEESLQNLQHLHASASSAFPSPRLNDEGGMPDDVRSSGGRLPLPSPEQLDVLARAVGVAGGLERWRAALARLAEQPAPASPGGPAAEPLRRAFEALVARLTPPPLATVAAHTAWVRGLVDFSGPEVSAGGREARAEGLGLQPEAGLDAPLISVPSATSAAASGDFEERDRAALERLDAALRRTARAAALAGDAPIPFGIFLAELEETLAAARFRPAAPGGIAALPVLLARGYTFEHVCLIGLSQGEFPRALPDPPVYDRAQRRDMRARGLPLPAPDPADEYSLFYEAVTRARTSLLLTRTRLDETGTPLERSPFLRALLELLDGVPVRQIAAGSVPDPAEAASPDELMIALVAHPQPSPGGQAPPGGGESGAGAAAAPEAHALRDHRLAPPAPVWAHIQRALAVERQRAALAEHGPHEGRIGDPALVGRVAAQFGPQHQWSPSQLNDYIICPYRFAAAHVLRLSPRRDPEDELDSARRGQLYHAILARAGERWREAGLQLAPEHAGAAAALLDQAAQELLDTAPEQLGFAPSPLWPWERDEVRRRLRAALAGFLRLSGAPRPVGVELDFGGRSASPPLRLETPHGVALIQGRIDRIDRRADGSLAVVDYKSGGTPHPLADALEGRDLQLALYALAAEQALSGGADAPVTRASFLHIGSGKASPALEGPLLQQAQQAARARAGEVLADVRRADFRVYPRDGCPDCCEFLAICRRNLAKRGTRGES